MTAAEIYVSVFCKGCMLAIFRQCKLLASHSASGEKRDLHAHEAHGFYFKHKYSIIGSLAEQVYLVHIAGR